MRRYTKPKYVLEKAKERILTLFEEAELNPLFADRYVDLARRISMKNKVSIPSELKKRFCKKCYTYFNKDNLRVRVKDNKLIYTCLECNNVSRYLVK